jgi:hypothetical protein
MSTSEYSTEAWPCGCGRGEVVYEYETPDHPWNPRTIHIKTDVTCKDCAKYVRIHDRRKVSGAPPAEENWEYLFFVDADDIAARKAADEEAYAAWDSLSRFEAGLASRAVRELDGVPSGHRYDIVRKMLGLPDAESAKRYINRRWPPSIIEGAVKQKGGVDFLANYYGQLSQLMQARAALQAAKQSRDQLGQPPVKLHSRRPKVLFSFPPPETV